MFVDISDLAPPQNAYIKEYAYDGSNNLIYEGWAVPGTATSAAKWTIRQYNYTGGLLTSALWADGNIAQDNVWDNRASLTYA